MNWTQSSDSGTCTATRAGCSDTATGYIEIQSFDGDVEELETGAWREMDMETAEAPEDWTGPFDDVEPDDLGLTETAMSPQDWRQLLEPTPAEEPWQDASPPDELEKEEEGRPLEPYAQEQEAVKDRAR
jgi:hypothetical protein